MHQIPSNRMYMRLTAELAYPRSTAQHLFTTTAVAQDCNRHHVAIMFKYAFYILMSLAVFTGCSTSSASTPSEQSTGTLNMTFTITNNGANLGGTYVVNGNTCSNQTGSGSMNLTRS